MSLWPQRLNSLNSFNITLVTILTITIKHNFFFLQGKKLSGNLSNTDDGEVSDEDEAADVSNESVKPPKKDSGHKIKLSPEFSACVGFKAVGFKGVEESINSSKKIMQATLLF